MHLKFSSHSFYTFISQITIMVYGFYGFISFLWGYFFPVQLLFPSSPVKILVDISGGTRELTAQTMQWFNYLSMWTLEMLISKTKRVIHVAKEANDTTNNNRNTSSLKKGDSFLFFCIQFFNLIQFLGSPVDFAVRCDCTTSCTYNCIYSLGEVKYLLHKLNKQ